MSMRQLLAKRLSTLLIDTDRYPAEHLIRVSTFVDPSDIEVLDDDGASPTIAVRALRGKTWVYGKIDREAWTEVQAAQRATKGESTVPWPTTAERSHREQMFR